ncbi:hypothetical protein [Amycolatopsis sp. Poz14]|uniref:hypothetical protein n=1 Tax=Amycolatopsis sp. Poz14 TaxID=1447705 RepID=UPI001EE9039E|nr:hypothetical protein [Amycolatopsis sp. Poz14]MCG3754302.1 hypothetical protein [Amycolatopsis sp. Poz14]
MDLTKRLAVVTKLFEAHIKTPFPAGFDLAMLDADLAGCVSTWLVQQGHLDDRRWNILAECEQDLIRAIPESAADSRVYCQRLLDMAVLVLEADSP